MSVSEAAVTELGLQYDRNWMLVGEKGQPITQRTHPQLARVGTAITGSWLEVTIPDVAELSLPLQRDPSAEEVPTELWKKAGSGLLVSTIADRHFSDYLQKDVRLLRVEQARTIRPECQVDGASTHTGFADSFPMLVTTEASLADLNTRLDSPVDMSRFRANIVVGGTDEAYAEDYWRSIIIGNMSAHVVRACARCPVPNIDQSVGELPRERPVTAALRDYRRGIDPIGGERGEFFGQNITHNIEQGLPMWLQTGDTVAVIEQSDQRNWLPLH